MIRFATFLACFLAVHFCLAEAPLGKTEYQAGVELLKAGDEVSAFDQFKKAMGSGYPDAFSAAGFFYANGRGGVDKDEAKALDFFLGSQAAQVNLARFYLEGRGVEADREKGLALMESAASTGSEDAHASLAEIYFLGLYDPESKPNFEKALPHVEASANGGNPSATNMLGVMYREGHAVEVDPKKAEELFRQAARKGNFKAQSNLGHLLDPSSKKRSRRLEAVAWLSLAADQGEPLAVYKMNELRVYLPSKELEAANQLAEKLRAEIAAD
ncbi:MAG: tetratricopeptide repeat protein [Verrucomicrobia bacterium]|nr:tetratricopeptide repeat protein [Verrucomicrobiota bacterium]